MSPRKSRLSSYYSRVPTADHTSPSQLTRTQPLDKLLRQIIDTKSNSHSLQSNLHKKTSKYYATLSDTQLALRETSTCAKELAGGQTLNNVKGTLVTCETVTEGLRESRASICELEGMRTAQLLLEASHDLTSTVASLCSQLSLCTDPVSLYDNLYLYAWRYSVVLPALLKMTAPVYKESSHLLEKCARNACALLSDSNSDINALTIAQSCKIRLLLGDNRDTILANFMQYTSKSLRDQEVSAMSVRGCSGVKAALLHVQYFEREVLGGLREACKDYLDLFGEEGAVVWIGDVVEDCLVSRVRSSLKDIFTDETDLSDFRKAIVQLNGTDVVGKILGATREGFEALIMELGQKEMQDVWKIVVDEMLAGEKHGWDAMMENLKKGAWIGLKMDTIEHDIVNYCLLSSQTFEETARSCVVLRKLGRNTGELESTAVSQALDTISKLFRECTNSVQVVSAIENAFALASKCRVEGLRRGGSVLDDGFGRKLMRSFKDIILAGEKDKEKKGGHLERFLGEVGDSLGVDDAVDALLTALHAQGD